MAGINSDSQWHLSKSIPISFLLAIIVQTAVLSSYVATIRSDVNTNGKDILRNEVRVESLESVVQNQSILLARIDENLKAIRNAIERNERSFDKDL